MAAPNEAEFYGVFDNGPIQAGLVSGNDAFNAHKEGFHVSNVSNIESTTKTFGELLAKVNPNMRMVAHAGVLFAIKIRNDCAAALTPGADGREKAAVTLGAGEVLKDATAAPHDAMKTAVSFIVATKLNWWMTNHHTGTPRPQGYVAKMLSSTSPITGYDTATPSQTDAFNTIVWRIGHWFDTRVMLSVMGIDIPSADPRAVTFMKELIAPAADLALRVNANPAGTAKVFDCLAAIRMLSGSMYTMVVPKPSDLGSIVATASAVRANMASFHEGAKYLTGRPKQNINQPEGDTIENLGVYLAVVRPQHTLKKAACFSSITADNNKELSSALIKISRAITDSKATQSQIDAAMSKGEQWTL